MKWGLTRSNWDKELKDQIYFINNSSQNEKMIFTNMISETWKLVHFCFTVRKSFTLTYPRPNINIPVYTTQTKCLQINQTPYKENKLSPKLSGT